MERALVEYIVNAIWQVPLLAGAAWLLLRMTKPGPNARYRVWLAVLALAVVLPLRGAGDRTEGEAASAGPAAGSVTESANGAAEPIRPSMAATSYAPGGGMREIPLNPVAARWLAAIFGVAFTAGITQLLVAWRGTRRLVDSSQEALLPDRARAVFEDYGRRLGVALPAVRESARVVSPVLAGLRRPVLLLPERFARHTAREMEAALCHELAHAARRDTLVNLLCQVAALPVAWHPATYAVQRSIRGAREMACDAMAAEEMQSPVEYAHCLLSLARSMAGKQRRMSEAQAPGLLSGNTLEERVMRLMEQEKRSAWTVALRAASGAAVMMAAVGITAAVHVTPTMAESKPMAPLTAQNAAPAVPAGSPVPAPVLPPATPAAPGALSVQTAPGAPPIPAAAPAPIAPPAPRAGREEDLEPGLTAAERQKIADAEAKINSPEIRRQMAEAQRKVAAAMAKWNDPAFRQQMDEARRRMAEARIDSADFQQKMKEMQTRIADATARIDSEEFRRQMADAQRQIAEATARIDSPVFRQKMAELQSDRLMEASRQLAAEAARLKAQGK